MVVIIKQLFQQETIIETEMNKLSTKSNTIKTTNAALYEEWSKVSSMRDNQLFFGIPQLLWRPHLLTNAEGGDAYRCPTNVQPGSSREDYVGKVGTWVL